MAIVSEYDWESDEMVYHTNGTAPAAAKGASAYDADLDSLYAWVAPQTPPPAPLPEAAFSLCLKGRLAGQDAQLTVRGATYAEFAANVAHVRGLLDPVAVPTTPTPASPQGQDATPQCPTHGVLRKGKRGWFCPHKLEDDSWCPSKSK